MGGHGPALSRQETDLALRQSQKAAKIKSEVSQRQEELQAEAAQAREEAAHAYDLACEKVSAARKARMVADDAWLRAKRDAAQADADARAIAGDSSIGFYGLHLDDIDDEDRPRYEAASLREYLLIQEPFGHGCASWGERARAS